jgi:hypothetical protein
MIGVMLGQSAVPTFLFTVHGHVHTIGGNGRRGKGPRGSPPCQRAPRVPRARQKYAKEVGAPVLTLQGTGEAEIVPDRAQRSGALMTSWGSGEAETTARGAYLARVLFARLGWDGGWLPALSD